MNHRSAWVPASRNVTLRMYKMQPFLSQPNPSSTPSSREFQKRFLKTMSMYSSPRDKLNLIKLIVIILFRNSRVRQAILRIPSRRDHRRSTTTFNQAFRISSRKVKVLQHQFQPQLPKSSRCYANKYDAMKWSLIDPSLIPDMFSRWCGEKIACLFVNKAKWFNGFFFFVFRGLMLEWLLPSVLEAVTVVKFFSSLLEDLFFVDQCCQRNLDEFLFLFQV